MIKEKLPALVASQIRRFPTVVDLLGRTANAVSPETVALLDFPVYSIRRWDTASSHRSLYQIIDKNSPISLT